jgi:hypothetical protein
VPSGLTVTLPWAGAGASGVAQRVAIGIAGDDLTRHGGVLIGAVAVRAGSDIKVRAAGIHNRQVVHPGDGNTHVHRRRNQTLRILDCVAEAVGSRLRTIVLIANRAIRIDAHRAVGWGAGDDDAGWVECAFHIAVIAHQVDDNAATLKHRCTVSRSHWGIVDGSDADIDRGGADATLAVGNRDSENCPCR